MRSAIISVTFFMVSACSHLSGPSVDPKLIPEGYKTPEFSKIKSIENPVMQPFELNDGSILFIRSLADGRPEQQLYRHDLEKKTTRRLTFQDGEISSVAVIGQNQIVYSSNTDEIKERPSLIRETLKKIQERNDQDKKFLDFSGQTLSESELYFHDLQTGTIERLTDSPYFDGQVRWRPRSSELAFVSVRKSSPQIYKMSVRGGPATLVSNPKFDSQYPAFSISGDLFAYVEKRNKEDFRLLIGPSGSQRVHSILTSSTPIMDLQFRPSAQEILFAKISEDTKATEIFSVQTDGTCLRRVTYSTEAKRFPIFTASGEELFFTQQSADGIQMVRGVYVPPSCPEQATRLNLKGTRAQKKP